MPLLEIVRTDKTSPQVIVDLMALGKAIKKTPVLVGNCTGFAVNRVFFPYTMAAVMLSDLGVDIYRIDNVIKSWGMPMGPFRWVASLLCTAREMCVLISLFTLLSIRNFNTSHIFRGRQDPLLVTVMLLLSNQFTLEHVMGVQAYRFGRFWSWGGSWCSVCELISRSGICFPFDSKDVGGSTPR